MKTGATTPIMERRCPRILSSVRTPRLASRWAARTDSAIHHAELVAAALATKEAVFCSNMMKELGFGARFDSVPLYIDNTSAPHVAENQS